MYDSQGNWFKNTKSERGTNFGESHFEPQEVKNRTVTYYSERKKR